MNPDAGAPPGSSIRDVGLPASTQALVDAVMLLSGDLDLQRVLTRLVTIAADLTQARYAALGVLGSDGSLAEFITTGMDDQTRAAIGPEPRGRGILGLLIDQPRPLRLDDLTTHPSSIGMPVGHPPMTTFLGVPIRIRDRVFGNLYLTEKAHGAAFDTHDQALVEALGNAAAIIIDNARAYGLSEQRRQWLQAAARITESVDQTTAADDAMRLIAAQARGTSEAIAAAIVEFPVDSHPVISASDGLPDGEVAEIVRRVLNEARYAQERRVALDVDLGEGYAVVVPIHTRLAARGALVVAHDRRPGAHSADEREFLARFAEHAGLALDRAEAASRQKKLAVVSERSRIARDLHDVVIQRLFAAGLMIDSLRTAESASDRDQRLEKIIEQLDQTITDIRTTIFDLGQPEDESA